MYKVRLDKYGVEFGARREEFTTLKSLYDWIEHTYGDKVGRWLLDSWRASTYKAIIEVAFRENESIAVCRNLAKHDIDFVNAVNGLAKVWRTIACQHGWQLLPFGNNNYGRRLEDGSLGVFFCRNDAEVVKVCSRSKKLG